MDDERAGHWAEKPLLAEAPAFPPSAIETHGASLVRIYGPDGPSKTDAGREAIVLARAKMPTGPWVILLAWPRHWAWEKPPHQTERAYWSWCLYEPQRVQPHRPPKVLYEGAVWNGWHEDSEINIAMRAAAGTLPGDMQAAALKPAEHQGPAEESANSQ